MKHLMGPLHVESTEPLDQPKSKSSRIASERHEIGSQAITDGAIQNSHSQRSSKTVEKRTSFIAVGTLQQSPRDCTNIESHVVPKHLQMLSIGRIREVNYETRPPLLSPPRSDGVLCILRCEMQQVAV